MAMAIEGNDLLVKITVEKLSCPKCNKFIRTKILQCKTKHPMCEKCFRRYKICETCNTGNTRSYYFDYLCGKFDHTCQFDGCDFTSSLREVEDHEDVCTYEVHSCPVKDCPTIRHRMDLIKHIKDEHANRIFQEDIVDLKLSELCEKQFILFNDELFTVCYGEDKLHVHSFNPNTKFKFSLFLYYKNGDNGRGVTISKICVNFNEDCWLRRNANIPELLELIPPATPV